MLFLNGIFAYFVFLFLGLRARDGTALDIHLLVWVFSGKGGMFLRPNGAGLLFTVDWFILRFHRSTISLLFIKATFPIFEGFDPDPH